MTAFIISTAIAFALYEFLASIHWPRSNDRGIRFGWGVLRFRHNVIATVRHVMRAVIVIAVLLSILVIHGLSWQFDVIANDEVNIVFGFLFGPLFAIWVNSVVVDTNLALSKIQIVAAIGLLVLFLIGALGNEASRLIEQYSHKLSSVKVAGAEVSFTSERSGRDRVVTSPFTSQLQGSYVAIPSLGLQNLASLDQIIKRDTDYLTIAFSPLTTAPELEKARQFAAASVVPPLSCLLGWFQKTADARTLDKYLHDYADTFRQLEALNTELNGPKRPPGGLSVPESQQLQEIGTAFVRTGLTMATDIAVSTTDAEVLESCDGWFNVYCRSSNPPPALPAIDFARVKCLRDSLGEANANAIRADSRVGQRVTGLVGGLADLIGPQLVSAAQPFPDPRGLEALPYFAIARAGLMFQLEQYEAAAAILDGWLQQNDDAGSARLRDAGAKPDLREDQREQLRLEQLKAEWLALRASSALVVYVDEWVEEKGAAIATSVQTEHLKNVRLTLQGFRTRLLKADFFKDLESACRSGCAPVFKRPTDCGSEEPREQLYLWKKLYLSFLTFEYTYIHRALQHPDYPTKYAKAVNDEARQLVNFDASCASPDLHPDPVYARDLTYAQSLLGFVENAVSYARLRNGIDSQDAQKKRLDEAEQAAKLALELVADPAADDSERAGKPYIDRTAASSAGQIQRNLNDWLKDLDQVRKDVMEQ